jgi:hypothetical protein
MLEALIPYLSSSVTVIVIGAVLRWGTKIDRALTAQNLATEKLIVRLDGHEELDDARFAAVRELINAAIASNGRPE